MQRSESFPFKDLGFRKEFGLSPSSARLYSVAQFRHHPSTSAATAAANLFREQQRLGIKPCISTFSCFFGLSEPKIAKKIPLLGGKRKPVPERRRERHFHRKGQNRRSAIPDQVYFAVFRGRDFRSGNVLLSSKKR